MAINTVLVVDDSPAELTNIKSILTDTGVTVLSATNGKEALELAKANQPDLIFMDVIMPEMDGFAACRELQGDAETKNIPVVFVTSKNQQADRMWAEMQGGKAYITKPYEADQIVDQLKTFQ